MKCLKVLGHVVSEEGIGTDKEKVSSIQHWPIPVSFKEVQSFLGLIGYYRRFVRNYSEIPRPLGELRKGDKFFLSEQALLAFNTLKKQLSSPPAMKNVKEQDEIILDTNTSNSAIGAVLSVKRNNVEHVVAYGSKSLIKRSKITALRSESCWPALYL